MESPATPVLTPLLMLAEAQYALGEISRDKRFDDDFRIKIMQAYQLLGEAYITLANNPTSHTTRYPWPLADWSVPRD